MAVCVTRRKFYTLTPQAGAPPSVGHQLVQGWREAINVARDIAESEHCSVIVRNEADRVQWTVAFRVRGGRYGARTVVEVTR